MMSATLNRRVEAVPAESLDAGARLWSERKEAELGRVVEVEEIDGGDRVRIRWRHMVNAQQSTISSQDVNRDSLIPVLCGT
jgi:hypothetical protein